jgi:methionine-rich copper-binding protein CopC
MNFTRRRFSRLVAMGAVLSFAAPYALAHSRPKVMVPAADSTVTAPATISVTFTEPLETKFSSLNVTDEKGKKINTIASKPAPNDPLTLTLALPPLQPGGYLVQWVSVAVDGHRMEGEYKFTVK